MPESLKKQLEEEKKIKLPNKLHNINEYELIWRVISKEYSWNEVDIDIIHFIEELIIKEKELSNNKKTYHDMNELSSTNDPYLTIHENTLYTWELLFSYLKEKQTNTNHLYHSHKSKLDTINKEHIDIQNKQKQLEEQLEIIKQERKQIEERKEKITNEIGQVKAIEKLNKIIKQVEQITKENKETNDKVKQVLKIKYSYVL